MVEEVVVEMGFTREEVKKARESHAWKETKSAPSLVAQLAKPSPFKKGAMKQKEKPKRTYVAVSLVASEIESEEETRKIKKKGQFVRVVRKL